MTTSRKTITEQYEDALRAVLGSDYRTPEQRAAAKQATKERNERRLKEGDKPLTRKQERALWHQLDAIRRQVAAFNATRPKPVPVTLKLSAEFDEDDLVEWHEEERREWKRRNRRF